ncbi:hypothetical protein [Anaeromyxobacter terrae]|uniref:hypothetical protein n=1 Tax=Anaeromyxobacter terrae TaxID=2925406 RepID=UPI001F566EDA|nr:hypothetical protein [Anaeromyxobacter sp. SG22]
MKHLRLALLALLVTGCASRGGGKPTVGPAPEGPPREKLNRASLELAYPFFWSQDSNRNGALDPDELALVWGLDARPREHWVKDGRFTPEFLEAWARVRARAASPAAQEDARHAALEKELAQSYFTVLESDFASAAAEERDLVRHVLEAARLVERLHARQLGTLDLAARIPADDGLSRLVFFLNQGPWCSGPTTEKDPACTAISPTPPRLSGLYPAELQANGTGFCDALEKAPRGEELTRPFSVVGRDASGALVPVPYHVAFRDDMEAIARELEAAGAAIQSPGEAALRGYLAAAARAFRTDDWTSADEAWSRMSAENSRFYLRVAPDEVYFEPCSLKAGFQLSFARIDRASLEWQRRLDPVKSDMEKALAGLAGPPYVARAVSFHLPDFIQIVVNAGDARSARGATVGQSLPNWGPVANEGRGRTVAMTSFYTDPESKDVQRRRAESILCPATLARYSDDADATVMGTVLHEAAHNLGPAHEYAVGGRTDDQIFGGPMASTLEELKAQTSALFLTDWLAARGILARDLAERAHVRDVVWTFGHISRGMYDAEGKVKPYSALAAIQVGFLLKEGGLVWRPEANAANGRDHGCLEVDFAAFPAAVTKLEQVALGVKARGDAAAARALEAEYVRGEGPSASVLRAVTERWLRFPGATFLYSVRY